MTFLCAALAAIAGLTGLLALGGARAPDPLEPLPEFAVRPPIEVADTRPIAPLRAVRLDPEAVERARTHALRRTRVPVRVQVTGTGSAPAGLGLALVDRESGATHAWRDLAGRTLPLEVAIEAVPVGRYFATLAFGLDRARNAYLNRVELEAGPGQGSSPALLAAVRHDLEVAIGEAAASRPAGVAARPATILVERPDDPSWLPAQPVGAVLDGFEHVPARLDTDRVVLRGLAPGSYVVRILGGDGRAELGTARVEVPTTTRVTIPLRVP